MTLEALRPVNAAVVSGAMRHPAGWACANMAVAMVGFYGLTGLMGGAALQVIGRKISSTA